MVGIQPKYDGRLNLGDSLKCSSF